jgi:hypothetical protein
MYLVYMDEAGTSAPEPVTVVAGIITHADRHWQYAFDELNRILNVHVPHALREGFIFHAKDLWNGYRNEVSWSFDQRRALVEEVVSIPFRLGIPIAYGKMYRDSLSKGFAGLPDKKLPKLQHVLAFSYTVAEANKYIREIGAGGELGAIVAEDVHDMRRALRTSLTMNFPSITPDMQAPTQEQARKGILPPQRELGRVDRIIDTIHFVDKDSAPLLQIADACAFSMRRYFAKQNFGDALIRSMLGRDLLLNDWLGPCSFGVFRPI